MSIHLRKPCGERVNRELINDRAKLIMHRLIARRIARRPQVISDIARSLPEPSDSEPTYLQEWRNILGRGPEFVRCRIVERSEEMDRLRISSPLGGVVDFRDVSVRRRIQRKAKLGAFA